MHKSIKCDKCGSLDVSEFMTPEKPTPPPPPISMTEAAKDPVRGRIVTLAYRPLQMTIRCNTCKYEIHYSY